MTSVAIAVPVGNVEQWCILPKWSPWQAAECADQFADTNATEPEPKPKPGDFFTVCCDGPIISRSRSLMLESIYGDARDAPEWEMWLDDLVCCNERESQQGAFFGPPRNIEDGIGTTCSAGTPTPLASMAAVNTDNAALYTYTLTAQAPPPGVSCDPRAVFGCDDLAGGSDSIWTATPYCLWMNTARASNAVTTITVPAADVGTLAPPTLIGWGSDDESTISSRVSASSADSGRNTADSSGTDDNPPPPTSSTSSTSTTGSASTESTPDSGQAPRSLSHGVVFLVTAVTVALGM